MQKVPHIRSDKLEDVELTEEKVRDHADVPVDDASTGPFAPYYPALEFDGFVRVMRDNAAHRQVVGGTVVGKNMIDLFFEEETRQVLVDWEGAVPLGIWAYKFLTGAIKDPDHEYRAEYDASMRRYANREDFRHAYDRSLSIATPDLDQLDSRGYFDAGPLWLRCPLNATITLQFVQVVRRLGEQPPRPGVPYFHEVLKPANVVTKAALVLLALDKEHRLASASNSPREQLHWGLTAVELVIEGLRRDDDSDWEPQAAFRRLYAQSVPEPRLENLKHRLRLALSEVTNQCSATERQPLLNLFISLACRMMYLELLQEILSVKPSRPSAEHAYELASQAAAASGVAIRDRRYQRIREVSRVMRLLSTRYPAWLLNAAGDIQAVNLPCAWKWGVDDPKKLLGLNVIHFFDEMLRSGYLPIDENKVLAYVKISALNEIVKIFGEENYISFIELIDHIFNKRKPPKFDQGWERKEWHYPINVAPGRPNYPRHLKFKATVRVVGEYTGFVSVSRLETKKETIPSYDELCQKFGTDQYIHYKDDSIEAITNLPKNVISSSVLFDIFCNVLYNTAVERHKNIPRDSENESDSGVVLIPGVETSVTTEEIKRRLEMEKKAKELEARGVPIHRIPLGVYPGMPYTTAKDVTDMPDIKYIETTVSAMYHKGLPHHHIESKNIMDPCQAEELLQRHDLSAEGKLRSGGRMAGQKNSRKGNAHPSN